MGVLEKLRDVLDELAATDPHELASAEDTLALAEATDRIEALTTRAFACFDASNDWMLANCQSAARWLSWKRNMHLGAAQRRRRLGRALRSMPATEAAWIAGEITGQHVAKLAQAQHLVPETFERDEKILVDDARTLRYGSFARAVDYSIALGDPDGDEERADKAWEDRTFSLVQSFENTWFATGTFDPISGTIIAETLKAIEHELFLADWAEAKARLGREPHRDELARTPAQRRADAAVEMAIRARTAPADDRRPEPLFSALVGYETLHGRVCELANRMVVSPGSLARWLDQAWIERVVFDPEGRVIDVGIRRRLFEGATRRALEVRDQECYHPSCEVPAQDCEADHVQPWAWGGPTIQDNGRMACPHHNRARHRRSEPPTP